MIGNFLRNVFQDTLSAKTIVLSVWKRHFSVLYKFLSGKAETFFWEIEAKHWKLFKSKFGHKKLLRKWFWSYLELKSECSERLKSASFNVWKVLLSSFSKLLTGEVESLSWESEAKRSKLFKSKFGRTKLLKKWFWRYLEHKNDCSVRLKRAFFIFLELFEWQSWNNFLGKWGKAFETIYIRIWS